MFEITLKDNSSLVVSPEHRVYASVQEENKLQDGLVGLIMMPESQKNHSSFIMVDLKDQDKAFENMNPPFSCKVVSQGFVTSGVQEDLIHLIVKNLSENRILFAGFIDCLPADRLNLPVVHVNHSKMSEIDFSLMDGSFFAFFKSSINSPLRGNSSTGCQSIFSQNSQSSSVISPVCLYLSNISRFINLMTDWTIASESKDSFSFINNSGISITSNNNNSRNYLNTFSLMKISDVYENLTEDRQLVFLDKDKKPVIVQSVRKVPYSGKIYDVDVENDIILVERGGTPVWSGNSNEVNETSLVGYWKLNSVNSSNHTLDSSRYGNNGQLITGGDAIAGKLVAGKFGNALSFDGADHETS